MEKELLKYIRIKGQDNLIGKTLNGKTIDNDLASKIMDAAFLKQYHSPDLVNVANECFCEVLYDWFEFSRYEDIKDEAEDEFNLLVTKAVSEAIQSAKI